jgi:DedD protein
MNDHNLDDLIIDNIDPKNSKTKSFLTIIALAIVVLIVAIILTKIILKDPHAQLAIDEENNVELISPELTLQSVSHKEPIKKAPIKTEPIKTEPIEKKLALHTEEKSQPIIAQPKPTTEVKPATVEITKEFSQEAATVAQKEKKKKIVAEKKATERKKAQAEKLAQEKKAAQLKKEKALEAEHLAQVTAAQEAKKEISIANGYFIQVGSFTQTPSSRFLSVIKNSGFNYKITPASSTGTKKLLIGPYASRAEVDTALVRVRDRINKSAFVVKK